MPSRYSIKTPRGLGRKQVSNAEKQSQHFSWKILIVPILGSRLMVLMILWWVVAWIYQTTTTHSFFFCTTVITASSDTLRHKIPFYELKLKILIIYKKELLWRKRLHREAHLQVDWGTMVMLLWPRGTMVMRVGRNVSSAFLEPTVFVEEVGRFLIHSGSTISFDSAEE